MLKAEIRKIAQEQRNSLSELEFSNLNKKLLKQFSALDFNDVKVVHTFLPILEKKEPNTFLMIEWLKQNFSEVKIIVPKANFNTSTMINYVLESETLLSKSKYGILEPSGGEIYYGAIDIVLVPLLAFDSRGYRAGYGKGFYDRFLEFANAKKIGLSLFEPINIITDVHAQDAKLDICITPTNIYKF